jgi:hypothetical protein
MGPSLKANRRRRKKGRAFFRRVVCEGDRVVADEVVEVRPGDEITFTLRLRQWRDGGVERKRGIGPALAG